MCPPSCHIPCSYSLFLAVFTFNAVVLCQYIGCCDVAGDPKVFAGKVTGFWWEGRVPACLHSPECVPFVKERGRGQYPGCRLLCQS